MLGFYSNTACSERDDKDPNHSWWFELEAVISLTTIRPEIPKSAPVPSQQRELLLRVLTIALICIVSFSIRLFLCFVSRASSMSLIPGLIFAARGSYKFWNWFDSRSWYPLGRIVGGTVYPGIMYTAALMYHSLRSIGFKVNIRDVCVLTAPVFSALTALATYGLTAEVKDNAAGVLAAAIVSIVPGYISRSVAGSYDNEGVAITAMVFCFYMWTKAVKTGSLMWSGLCTLSYLYMVACWGGYIFLINLIPVYVLVMLFSGRYSDRLYVAYNTFYILGSLLSMQIRFVGFNAVQTSEHLGAFGTFGLLNLYCVGSWVRNIAGPKLFKACIRWLVLLALALVGAVVFLSVVSGFGGGMTGRIPPAAAMLSAIGISESLKFFMRSVLHGDEVSEIRCSTHVMRNRDNTNSTTNTKRRKKTAIRVKKGIRKGANASSVQVKDSVSTQNSTVAAPTTGRISYSSPSIVLSARGRDGSRIFFDDYREGYYWLRQNTPEDAKIMSWWDYGYQISGMANRTVIVDNNTWNNSHIATVGKAMNSPEDVAYKIARKLDVDYVLVIFGGVIGYSSDDINKFLWMVRIAASVDSTVKERDYLNAQGGYTVDDSASPTMKESLMYKLSYYRFGDAPGQGHDRVRNAHIRAAKSIKLKHFEEAYTSENWIVRIFRVKKPDSRGWV
eukprot:IDg7773t1